MIIPNLKGGLGNQMFQIATGFALAKRLNTEFAINYNMPFNKGQGNTPLSYKDTLYKNIPSTDHVPKLVYNDPKFSYTEIKIDSDDCIIDGYFQSSKYFSDINKASLPFWFDPESTQKFQEKVTPLGYPLIGWHVRRGDYKGYPTTHPCVPKEYYYVCTETLRWGSAPTLIATDDPNTIVSEFNDIGNYIKNPIWVNGQSEIDDLILLQLCDVLMLSNSSFAWWAAFLGNAKIVYAPQKWFGPDGPQDYQDIYEPTWTIK